MAGTQTHNFDLVIQLAENAIGQWMSDLLDNTSPQGGDGSNIFEQLFNNSAFSLSLKIDRPSGIPNSAGDVLAVDITVASIAQITFAVEVKVDRSEADKDKLVVDFANGVHAVAVDTVLPDEAIIRVAFEAFIRSLGVISIMSIPVTRGTADAAVLERMDIRLIDDRTTADRDALAVLLSFGGASGQNAAGFTQSVIEPPHTGAILIFFGWICRMLAPRLEAELGLPVGSMVSSADRCEFSGDHVLDEEEDVSLKLLSIRLIDDAIKVSAEISKSGFCYTATGKVSATLSLEVVDGELKEDLVVDDPDVDVDVPWECWLIAVAVGAITGGLAGFLIGGLAGGIGGAVVGGIIGGVLGGLLFPIILWVLTEIVEGVIETVASEVSDAINSADPNLNIPLPLISLVFQDIAIDDITLHAKVRVTDHAPVRCQGEVSLRQGQSIDFDTGEISNREGIADLGLGVGGLSALCNTQLARLPTGFAELHRFDLYPLLYQRAASVPSSDFMELTVFPFPQWQTKRVSYAFRTTQGRYGAFEVIHANTAGLNIIPTTVKLRFRTYGESLPGAKIIGNFGVKRPKRWDILPTHADTLTMMKEAHFTPTAWPAQIAPHQPQYLAHTLPVQSDPRDTLHIQRKVLWATAANTGAVKAHSLRNKTIWLNERKLLDRPKIGQWNHQRTYKLQTGDFYVQSIGLGAAATIKWSINGAALNAAEGSLQASGAEISWIIQGNLLQLSCKHPQGFNFSLEASAVSNSNAEIAKASRCISYKPILVVDQILSPDFRHYKARLASTVPVLAKI